MQYRKHDLPPIYQRRAKKCYLAYDKLVSQRVLDRPLSPRPIDAIYIKIKAQILACADPLDFITLNEKNMLEDL